MRSVTELADSVKIVKNRYGISVISHDPALELIGSGRSAAVFKINGTVKALKVFYPGFENIALEEADIYRQLEGIPYFPAFYESGRNYLLIDLIEGITLFDCLSNGVRLTEANIKEIDRAISLAKQQGLTPSDIHLRNIILTTDGNIKLIDVARFRQTKNFRQWDDLRKAFYMFYEKSYFPKRIPVFVLNGIAYLYNKKVHKF
ncbi:protein kinase family protein [Virgibacillus doumboii]|uniref:protein kinase family protein n=1 Tax=Virgibacillus doumboii TaxID=2697503 RepID=UPI0013DE8581|nr:protein kinase family protein [Virgibacillus doumboii]